MKNIANKFGLLAVGISILFTACNDMDGNYEAFIKGGPITYVGKVDSAEYFAGINKVKLSWKLSSDPAIKRLKVFWREEGKKDSVEKAVEPSDIGNDMEVLIENLPAGTYPFNIITYDSEGNSSLAVELFATVWDMGFINTLLPTFVSATEYSNSTLTINWGINADTSYVGSEVHYIDKDGLSATVPVSIDADETEIEDYRAGTAVRYVSYYFPPNSLDTLATVETGIPVRYEYPKDDWTAIAAYDEPSNRGPWNAIDNNPSSVWHMSKLAAYPQPITVDMGEILPVNGMVFMQRQDNIDWGMVKQVDFQVSIDNVSWESKAEVELPFTQDVQYIAFEEQVQIRYFRVIIKSDYNDKEYTALSELGAYTML